MPAPSPHLLCRLARERFKDFALRAPRRAGRARSERFIDGICGAICAAWSQWQSQAVLSGVIVEDAVCRGGKLLGPALGPLILARAPAAGPWDRKHSKAVAITLGEVWSAWVGSISVPALVAAETPLGSLGQATACLNSMGLLSRMALALGEPLTGLDREMLHALAEAFVTVFRRWHAGTVVAARGGHGDLAQRKPMFVLR